MKQRVGMFTRFCCVSALLLQVAGCSRKQETSKETTSARQFQRSATPTTIGVRPIQSRHTETPSAPLPPEQAAVLATIQQKIQSDPRIKSKTFTVTIENRNGPEVVVRGRVADRDEKFALMTDVESSTDYGIMNTLSVEKREYWETTHAGPVVPPPAFVEPANKPKIPICPGMRVVTAIAQPDGDYESIKTVESVDAGKIVLAYSTETKDPWWETPHPQVHLRKARRTVMFEDMRSSHSYDHIFLENGPEDGTGTTAIGVSAAVIQDLKTKAESRFSICGAAAPGTVLGPDRKPKFVPGGCYSFANMTLHRVEDATVPIRVVLNGTPVDLPAIHAIAERGADYWSEFYFLDDEQNPLTLAFRLGINYVVALTPYERHMCETAGKKGEYGISGDPPASCDLPMGGDVERLRTVSIAANCHDQQAPSANAGSMPASGSGEGSLEQSLAAGEKVDVYSIYFSFNSDALREESEPTLKEIADVLRKHRDWNLRVAGHTDNIGSDAANLDLSRRRAEAVKTALVQRHGIDASRLATTGFGESQPLDTNDTLEGRARNRRVELSRVK